MKIYKDFDKVVPPDRRGRVGLYYPLMDSLKVGEHFVHPGPNRMAGYQLALRGTKMLAPKVFKGRKDKGGKIHIGRIK